MSGTQNIEPQEISELEERFHKAINDDLNMPAAMSVIWEIIRNPNKSKQYAKLLVKLDKVLGLNIDKELNKEESLPEEIQRLIQERKKARQEKNWGKSDEIRDIIIEKGYTIQDTKNGMKVEYIGKD